MDASDNRWWGPLELPSPGAMALRVGPLSLHLLRGDQELRVSWAQDADHLRADLERRPLPPDTPPPEDHQTERFIVGPSPVPVTLRPLLADRPVVVRPETRFTLPAGGQIRVYVSSPVWLELSAGAAIFTRPTYRPSDTWFGPSPRDGELCYAGRTLLRGRLSGLPRRPHRAVTPVIVRNKGDKPLLIERLKLPTRHLSLYDGDDRIWTEAVTLESDKEPDHASVRTTAGPPNEAPESGLVTPPREPHGGGDLVARVFSSVFSNLLG